MADDHSTAHIFKSLAANLVIAVGKGVAATLTGSGALMAETLHSFADCGNQILLLFGVRRSQRPPDDSHPLGYGRDLYFWSFMVALLLFSGGGVFSIYEGVHKIRSPEAINDAWIGFAILGASLVIEGWATYGNIAEMNARRGDRTLLQYLRDTKDSDLVVIFGENAAAVLGLGLAMLALALAWWTGDGRWDGVGSVGVGLVLVAVAVFLAVEVKSLLVGEAADEEVNQAIVHCVAASPGIVEALRTISIQQGPGEVMVAMKVRVASELSADDVCRAINDFETALHARCPAIRWCFVEPDLEE
ncbi:MAG: cation diffusion facilitator family transporter [Nannocystaceae bacterium]